MGFISENDISKEKVDQFDEEMTLEIANRIEKDNYSKPFIGLKNSSLLGTIAIYRPELTSEYNHLFDKEAFDEK